MSSDMYHRRSLVTLVFVCAVKLVSGAKNGPLHIQGLFPLTGKQATRGYAELAGTRMAMKVNKGAVTVQFGHNDTKCNAEIESRATLHAIATEGTNVILIGGGCQGNVGGTGLPQLLFESTYIAISKNVINFRPTILSTHDAMIGLLQQQGWDQVAIVYEASPIYSKGSAILKDQLLQENISTNLYMENDNQNAGTILMDSSLRVVIVYTSAPRAQAFLCNIEDPGHRYRWILPTVNSTRFERPCKESTPTVISLSIRQVKIDRDFARDIEQIYDIHGEAIVSAAYAYDASTSILQSLDDNQTPVSDVIMQVRNSTVDGATGLVQLSKSGQRLFYTDINVYIGKKQYSYGNFFDELSLSEQDEVREALNIPDKVKKVLEVEGVGTIFFAIMTSLAIIVIIYAITIMGYVIKKRDERFYKMTSPNINVIVILSSVLGCLHVILSGLSGVKSSQALVKNVHVVCRYFLCIALSLFYGSVLMKTWRVYVIFKNLNANGKLTRDIVLVSVILSMVIVDFILVSIWSFADPLQCNLHNTSQKYIAETGVDKISQANVCWSDLQPLWVIILYLYKAAILAACVYFAWQTRHVTLPSMQDAPYIYVVILNGAFIGVLLLPSLVLYPKDERLSYGVASLAILYLATANLSLLFIPKMLMYRQIQKGLKKDDKLAFSESLKKTQEAKDGAGCLTRCFGSTEKDNNSWQEALGVEIESLKAAVKQKDSTIRELTDRLYYGADKFQQYLTRRQPSAGSINNVTSGKEQLRVGPATSRPTTPKVQATPRPVHGHVNHAMEPETYRSRSNSKCSRVSIQIHSRSASSSSTGDDDEVIPTPRLVMAPAIEQRSNLHAIANVAHVKSLEDISHDSAIENPQHTDSSDKDSEQFSYQSHKHPQRSTPMRPEDSFSRLPFPTKNPHGAPGSDDSGIAAIYSPINMPNIYSPLEYKNHRNHLPTSFMYEERMDADTIV